MKQKVVLFGLGDFARVASAYLDRSDSFEVAAFTADSQFVQGPEFMGKPIVPFESLEEKFPPSQFSMFVAIGFKGVNRARQEVYERVRIKGYSLITYVSPAAFVWDRNCLGDNCFVFENNVIQPFVKIGNNVILWSGNHIGHDCTIGDHSFISSHVVLSGHAKVGQRCFLGVNSTIRDGVTLGDDCVIGAGSLILKDAPSGSVFKGAAAELSPVPSHRLKGF